MIIFQEGKQCITLYYDISDCIGLPLCYCGIMHSLSSRIILLHPIIYSIRCKSVLCNLTINITFLYFGFLCVDVYE